MKPNWKDAPEWANYLAQDEDGAWYWYEYEPDPSNYIWRTTAGQIAQAVPAIYPRWKSTKESRPE